MPETMPWGQLALACWPLWLAYAAMGVVWWAGRVRRG